MAAITSQDQRSYIKIECQRNKPAKEIFNALQEACGTSALSYSQVTRWVSEFKNGRESVEDAHRAGRNVTVNDDYHAEQLNKLLKSDRRITCEEMAHELDISVGSVHSILRNRLKMRKVSARWVPHRLTLDQVERRLEVATNLRSRFDSEGQDFLSRIVAIDETWIRSYEPEMKRQSAEWHTPSSPRPAKYRRTQSKLKMLMIFAYDRRAILTSHKVETGKTINGRYYEEYIKKVLRPAIRRKRPELLAAGPILLHDNATPHGAQGVTSLLERYEWETLDHPPYSPDLSPCDFDLFPKLKEDMRGIRYTDIEALELAVAARVRVIENSCLATGIADLPKRWKSVIDHKGCYFEGM